MSLKGFRILDIQNPNALLKHIFINLVKDFSKNCLKRIK